MHVAVDVVELQQAVMAGEEQPGVRLAARGRKYARLPVTGPEAHRARQLLRMAQLPAEPAAPEAVVLQQPKP